MSKLKVYYDLISQPARAVLALLKVNGIPYEGIQIQLRKGEHLSEDYVKLNPFHRIPMIIDDGFKLMESVAILRYLCATRNLDDYWYPKDPKLQARVDEYLEWQHIDIRSNTMGYLMNKFMLPAATGVPPDEQLVNRLESNLEQGFDNIENLWLQNGKKYLTGEKMSIADLLGVFEACTTKVAGYDPRINRPNLTSWMDRMRDELNPHYDELNATIDRLTEKFKGVPPLRKN
ncbi:glutathione S-transferase theta-1-like [Ischnura elegans]|uniref:glutathione S-transferase theta-1-like n=1 Tax=Ischnura elegans TaxID=197161 RepID=UPI001ED8B577|nr:glutathione S-transferase theta-1-like [Ischnura elegans]